MPAIPYLVPEFVSVAAKNSVPHSGVHFPLFFLGFARSRIFRLFRVFRLFRFSRVQIRNSGFSVFSAFSAFSGFQGSKSRIPVFPFFPLFRAPNPDFRGHGSGHVWCGHVWRAPKNGTPDSDRSAIGKPAEICDRDRMAIRPPKIALSAGILAIEAPVIGCNR